MTRDQNHHPRPVGHPLVAAATIGGLSLILAGGLELLGFLTRLDEGIARRISLDGAENHPRHLPEWGIWVVAGGLAFGLAAAILGTPGHWRRWVLWITTVLLVVAWAPVLSLAAFAPDIAAPWVATLWAGVCAVVYAANHRMACDAAPAPTVTATSTSTDAPR